MTEPERYSVLDTLYIRHLGEDMAWLIKDRSIPLEHRVTGIQVSSTGQFVVSTATQSNFSTWTGQEAEISLLRFHPCSASQQFWDSLLDEDFLTHPDVTRIR